MTPSPTAGFDGCRGTGPIAYSNLGVGLLGLALVNTARAGSYTELVRSRICVPLRMASTDTPWRTLTDTGSR